MQQQHQQQNQQLQQQQYLDGPEVSEDVDLEGFDDLVVGGVQHRGTGHDPGVVHYTDQSIKQLIIFTGLFLTITKF